MLPIGAHICVIAMECKIPGECQFFEVGAGFGLLVSAGSKPAGTTEKKQVITVFGADLLFSCHMIVRFVDVLTPATSALL
ncbi:hypothetical protein [Nocardia salmonicida]|uniref:hypothetical protein n=1 Tax=Nocardia salmonicida TaxID=53431 RepID=UPI00378EADEF